MCDAGLGQGLKILCCRIRTEVDVGQDLLHLTTLLIAPFEHGDVLGDDLPVLVEFVCASKVHCV